MQRSPDIMRKCRLSRPLRDDNNERSVIYKQFSKPDIYPHCIKKNNLLIRLLVLNQIKPLIPFFLKLHAQVKSVSIFITFRDHFMQLRKILEASIMLIHKFVHEGTSKAVFEATTQTHLFLSEIRQNIGEKNCGLLHVWFRHQVQFPDTWRSFQKNTMLTSDYYPVPKRDEYDLVEICESTTEQRRKLIKI